MKKRLLIFVVFLLLGISLFFPIHASAHALSMQPVAFSHVTSADVLQGLQSGLDGLKQATEHVTDSTHKLIMRFVDGLWQWYESTLDTSGYVHHN